MPLSPPTERASLTKKANNCGLDVFNAPEDEDFEKIRIKDFSNQQGLAGNSIGNNELISQTKKTDHAEALSQAKK